MSMIFLPQMTRRAELSIKAFLFFLAIASAIFTWDVTANDKNMVINLQNYLRDRFPFPGVVGEEVLSTELNMDTMPGSRTPGVNASMLRDQQKRREINVYLAMAPTILVGLFAAATGLRYWCSRSQLSGLPKVLRAQSNEEDEIEPAALHNAV